MTKTQSFVGKNVDIERLSTRIENYLTENKFEVGYSRDHSGESYTYLIQARKSGLLRTASGSRRSTDIKISGTPNNFEVNIGTGEWGKNLVTSAPLFVIPIVGIAATITKLYTAKKFEDNLFNYVRDQIKHLENTYAKGQPSHFKEYSCDYVEGYPEWTKPIIGAKMVLEHQKGQNCVVFKLHDGKGMKIPSHRIEKAEIVTKKTKFDKADRMLQITFEDDNGKKVKPIFNFSDEIIRGVLAGIDELASETKLAKMTLTATH